MNVAKSRQVRKIDDFGNEATLLRITQVTKSIIPHPRKGTSDLRRRPNSRSCEELATITYCNVSHGININHLELVADIVFSRIARFIIA